MAIGWLVAVGLFLDVLGAASLAVPDLPREYRYRFRRYTPLIRGYVINMEKLEEMKRDDIDDIDQLRPVLRELWPAFREVRSEDPGPFDDIEIRHGDVTVDRGSPPDGLLEFGSPDGWADVPAISYRRVGEIGDHIQSLYRVGGLGMLCCGFLIQIVAQLG